MPDMALIRQVPAEFVTGQHYITGVPSHQAAPLLEQQRTIDEADENAC
jgi:hypothetical protein